MESSSSASCSGVNSRRGWNGLGVMRDVGTELTGSPGAAAGSELYSPSSALSPLPRRGFFAIAIGYSPAASAVGSTSSAPPDEALRPLRAITSLASER